MFKEELAEISIKDLLREGAPADIPGEDLLFIFGRISVFRLEFLEELYCFDVGADLSFHASGDDLVSIFYDMVLIRLR